MLQLVASQFATFPIFPQNTHGASMNCLWLENISRLERNGVAAYPLDDPQTSTTMKGAQ